MTHGGYAIAATAIDRSDDGPTRSRVRLTDRLGCTETTVDAYRPRTGEPARLPAPPESVCVPLDDAGELVGEETWPVPRRGIARVAAGSELSVRSDGGTRWLVVSAPADPTPERRPVVVDATELAFTKPATSDVVIARLTARLGCRGTKTNVRRLEPGDAVPYHTEGEQEELFVPLDGPGTIRVAGTTRSMRAGDVARVAPSVPRGVVNEGPDDRLWLMIGAPPTGDPDEWDPGAEILEWPETG